LEQRRCGQRQGDGESRGSQATSAEVGSEREDLVARSTVKSAGSATTAEARGRR